MSSRLARLQKLNKEATPAPWEASRGSTFNQAELRAPDPWNGLMLIRKAVKEDDIDLIVECRNSLPAVLNLIEESQRIVVSGRFGPGDFAKLEAVLAPFMEEEA